MTDPDDLYTTVWPDYFEVQARDLFWYERLWGVLLDQLEKRSHHRRRSLLEFGSGPGFLLRYAKRRGWAPIGVEPSGVARTYSRALGSIALDAAPGIEFYAGIATEVLEHVVDAKATLATWRDALVPGGLLALSVPNDNNPLQRLFGRRLAPRAGDRGGLQGCEDPDRPWIHHTHLHYFNPTSLHALVEDAGFKVVWQRTSFPVEPLLVLPIPRKMAWKLSRIWPAPPLLWRWNLGRHVLLVAQKV